MPGDPKPSRKPARPWFSSGPCAKRPGWTLAALEPALVGRSHRAKPAKARIAEVIERSRRVLGLPAEWRLAVVPASDTGAMETILWHCLGARGDSASMPCAASPPSTFCHDQVTTSSLSQAMFIANTAEVASQSTRPARSAGIQSAFGTRTPDVVPFQVKITSRAKFTLERSGSAPYSADSTRASSFSCLVTSVTHS